LRGTTPFPFPPFVLSADWDVTVGSKVSWDGELVALGGGGGPTVMAKPFPSFSLFLLPLDPFRYGAKQLTE